MTNELKLRLWVVVKVHSGIPICVELFQDEEGAWELERQIREDINPEYDEVDVFCSEVK